MESLRINLGAQNLETSQFKSWMIYFLSYWKWVLITAFSALILIAVFMGTFNIDDQSTLTVIQSIFAGAVGSGIATFFAYSLFRLSIKKKLEIFYGKPLKALLNTATPYYFTIIESKNLLLPQILDHQFDTLFSKIQTKHKNNYLPILTFGSVVKYIESEMSTVTLYWDNKVGFFILVEKSDIIFMTNNDFTPNNANENPQDQPLNFNKDSQQSPSAQNPYYSSPYSQQPQPSPSYSQPAAPQPQQPQPPYQSPYAAPQQQVPYGYGAPAPQQPYYNQAPQQNPYQQVAPRKNNSFAVTAFVLGLAQILLWWAWIPAPLAVVFGHIALSQIKKTNEEGRVFALIGLILGYVGIVIGALVLFFIFWASAFDSYNGYDGYSDYEYDENCYTCGSELM